jgi:tetratricopeptide (TPR) repeat protein
MDQGSRTVPHLPQPESAARVCAAGSAPRPTGVLAHVMLSRFISNPIMIGRLSETHGAQMRTPGARRFLGWILLLFTFAPPSFRGQETNEDAIRRYSDQATQAMARKDAEAATVALEKLASLTPNVPEVYANLGTVYYTQGRYPQAAQAFERALRLNPKLSNAPLMLGICYADLGRAKEAIPILEPAFRHPPNNEVGRTIGLKLMSAYLSLDMHTKALEVIEEMLARSPNDPELLYRASHLYGDRALQTMVRLVQVAPESAWKRMAFAEALEAEKRYDLAIREYRKVLGADPGFLGAHYRLGRALLLNAVDSKEAREEAIKEFQLALVQDPRNAGAEYELGEIYRRRGQPEQAVEHFSRAVEIDPRFEDARIGLARALIQLEKPKEALLHLRTAVELNPRNEVSHFLLARAYRSVGDTMNYQKEMALFQKYHLRPYAEKGAAEEQVPSALTNSEATKQTLDSEPSPQP